MFKKTVNGKSRLTTIRVEWKDGFSELMRILKNFFDDNDTEHLLLDLRNSSLGCLTYEHVRDLCEYATSRTNGESRVNGKTALVGLSALEFGISNMLKTYGENEDSAVKVSLFCSIEKALSWIEEG